jgi:hypothetical protein
MLILFAIDILCGGRQSEIQIAETSLEAEKLK